MKESDYLAGLEYAQKHAPDHPLLTSAARCFSAINVRYLERVLATIPPPVKKVRKKKVTDHVGERLAKNIGKLFTQRAKESNRFHSCANDTERRAVSVNVMNIQEEIGKALITQEHYKITGELPVEEDNPKFKIPDDPILLIKLRNNLYSSISQIKKELRDIHRTNDADRKTTLESRLGEKETYLTYVKNRLKKANI